MVLPRTGRPRATLGIVVGCIAEHVPVQVADHLGEPLLVAKDAHRLLQPAQLRERVEGELVERELGIVAHVVVSVGAKLIADHAQSRFLAGIEIGALQQPGFKARTEFGGALLRD